LDNRNRLFPKLLNNFQYLIGVELGVFRGNFSKIILDNWGGTLYLIDVWRSLSNREYNDISNQQSPNEVYSKTIENISRYENRAFMLRMSGNKAVNLFQDYSLDFIYIDANHTYESVKQDVHLWYPKIRLGGMISGHDYLPKHLFENESNKNIPIYDNDIYMGSFGVNLAVDEFVKEYNLELNLIDEFYGTWWIIK
jgi:hypothetical protein